MVAANHLIWTIYGVWLPNDPRGSSSTEIRSAVLEELGQIHHGRKKIQPSSSVIRKFYREATPLLKHEVLRFSGADIVCVAEAIGQTIAVRGYTCYGCAIMPDHVHLLIRKHKDRAEDMICYSQDDSWSRLQETKRWPSGHPVWGGPGWKVFLDTPRTWSERSVTFGIIQSRPEVPNKRGISCNATTDGCPALGQGNSGESQCAKPQASIDPSR